MYKVVVALVVAVMGLTGCGSMRLVDSEVRSFATPPLIPAGALFRFERLPSQQADAAAQTRLEALAQQALEHVGLQRHDRQASYSVLVNYGMKVDARAPWEQPEPGFGFGWGLGWGGRGGSLMLGGRAPFGQLATSPYYWRQVSLIIRSLSTQQVVFESQVAHDGRWADTEAVLPAMFDAALRGFPNPPPGVRHINIDIPR
jgi:hypothetical protein